MKLVLALLLPFLIGPLFINNNNGLECKNMKTPPRIYDGPYVSYNDNWIYVQYITGKEGELQAKTDSFPAMDKPSIKLSVNSEKPGEVLTVYLKDKLENEKAEYSNVSRQFALSDIEGNFTGLKKLLLAGGVIDSAYNWTFGDGHLVLTGDFFDRGQNVTEVLWLIYSLEDKAKKAGGYVHFILGNHEIMNLSGDIRYVHNKYISNASLLGKNYLQLFDSTSELGRWLRTKNIVEKIGNVLYTHGGISPEINKLGLTVPFLNNLARPYFADSNFIYTDTRLDTVMSDLGPFWYRGYYSGNSKATMQTIDSSFSLFSIGQIVTGHTIVSDKITTWFDRKVINTDVPHAKGNSEALYIEGTKYYVINGDGKKSAL